MIPYKITAASATPVSTDRLTVRQIRWVGATTAGHKCEIQDVNDLTIWESEAAGASYVESDALERQLRDGFKVPVLDSGTLYVYADRGKLAS